MPTKPRQRYQFAPLTMAPVEVAENVFRKGESWFRAHIHEFPDFPEPDPRTGLYSVKKVKHWVDGEDLDQRESGIDWDTIGIERARSVGRKDQASGVAG